MKLKSQRKAFSFELKSANEDGTFTGVASVYGNKDLQGDIVDKGAFTKTLSERGADIPILWQHDPTTPIGLGTLTDSPSGLKISGKLSLGTSKGKDAYELLKDGVVTGLSIGYDVIKQKFADGARHLAELKLYEVSCVTFPASEDALVADVKAATRDLPPFQAARVEGFLTKDASLNDKLSAVYSAVQAAFPLWNSWVVDVFDAYTIVCVGGDRYFSIALTWGADGDDVTLGEATEVERIYQPIGQVAKSLDVAMHQKAGARHSRTDQSNLDAAHDAIVAAGAKCDQKSAHPGTSSKEAAPAAADPDLLQSLRALNDTLRPKTAAA